MGTGKKMEQDGTGGGKMMLFCSRSCWQRAGYMAESFDIVLSEADDLTTFVGFQRLLTLLLSSLAQRIPDYLRFIEHWPLIFSGCARMESWWQAHLARSTWQQAKVCISEAGHACWGTFPTSSCAAPTGFGWTLWLGFWMCLFWMRCDQTEHGTNGWPCCVCVSISLLPEAVCLQVVWRPVMFGEVDLQIASERSNKYCDQTWAVTCSHCGRVRQDLRVLIEQPSSSWAFKVPFMVELKKTLNLQLGSD